MSSSIRCLPHLLLVATALTLLASTPPARGQPQPEPGVVPFNGHALDAVGPLGPGLEPARLAPRRGHQPSRAVWAGALAARARFQDPAAVPTNIQVSRTGETVGASRPVNDFSEVMVAVDPSDPEHLLGASKFFYDPPRYRFYTGVFESFDGGRTWDQRQPDGVEDYALTSDPVTTFDRHGNGYFTLLTRGPTGLDMLRKPAGGQWQAPVVVDRTTTTDKQWIAADQDPHGESPYADRLYMSWTAFDDDGARIVLAVSDDGNETWSDPVDITRGNTQGSIPVVAPDGTLYVGYMRSGRGTRTLEIARSGDGGQTFGAPREIVTYRPPPWHLPNSTFRTPGLPAFAVSPIDGALYVVWAGHAHADVDAFLSRSTDGGETWSEPYRLNDDPVDSGVDQFQPQIAIAPTGRVAVSWFDRRLPCPDRPGIPADHVGNENFCIDTFMARSADGGLTWQPNLRVSAETWDWSLNLPLTSGGDGFIGDYQGLAATADVDYPFWNATSDLGDNPEREQQAFVARVPADLEAPPTATVAPTTTSTPTPTATATPRSLYVPSAYSGADSR